MSRKKYCSLRTRKKAGFSLIEIAVCICLILAAYSFAITSGIAMTDNAMTAKARSEAAAIGSAVAQYYMELEEYPESLDKLLTKKEQFGPWLREIPEADPWGNPYQYKYNIDVGFAVYSFGADEFDSGSSVEKISDGDIGFIGK